MYRRRCRNWGDDGCELLLELKLDSDSTEILEGLTDQHMDLISEGSGGSVYSMNEQKQEDSGGSVFSMNEQKLEDSGGGGFDPLSACWRLHLLST
jgi:hypothetical protein